MNQLLSKFKETKRCEACIEPYDIMDGCIFRCGHVYHLKCITSMEHPSCRQCNIPYNPNEIYQLALKFLDKLIDQEYATKQQKKMLGKKAIELLMESALLGITESQYKFGFDDFKNDYMRSLVNEEDGLFFLKKAAHNHHLNAILELMTRYKSEDDIYYYYCEMAANENHVRSQIDMCIYYEKKNPTKCLTYVNMAAKNNSITAYRFLYYYYKEGTIVPKNLELAYDYLSKVACLDEKGISQYEMSLYYKEIKDEVKLLYWYKLSVEKGYQPAQIDLGGYYIMRNEPELAYKLLKKNQEHPLSMYFLGYYYEFHIKSYEDALHWYTKSANKNIKYSQYRVYCFYENGIGTEKDIDQSIDYLIMGADNGHSECQFILAQKYEIGYQYKGKLIQSDKKAKKYYQLAANDGNKDALNALKFYRVLNTMK